MGGDDERGWGTGEPSRASSATSSPQHLYHCLHKESMDHSSGPVLAVSGEAIGCQGVCAFHISLSTAFSSLGLTHRSF